ncbi:MAG: helix-turn-helix domain-containing protein [Pseudomonadota bacterium]|uniref:GlxA family transcriptional regulator n=1 Tax=Polaromonas sp. TaxID=1869339 RepID=UPI0018382E4F|nr:helix-turn-helix domain-containing protein [Polaromonas sp.]MBA3594464.1 helix-turn-helix domain-containing protein [Polaromonas sp.]MDQ3273355.1 helix-turn-helix domain-containing protein [Pseudomonadota bacterium]
MTKKKKPLRIAILAYEACMGTEIFGLVDVLLIASHLAGHMEKAPGVSTPQPFDVQVVGMAGRTVTVAGGVAVGVKQPRRVFDLLVVPGPEVSRQGAWDARLAPLSRELAFIKKSFARGTPVASVCAGTFLLGEAGLLADRKVTTAWIFAKDLAQRYPAAKVDAEAVLVEDGAVTTTGAVTSVFDLAIHIVKRTLGARVATATARVALLQNPRLSQAPYVDAALVPSDMPSFSQSVAQWLGQRLSETYNLERLAQAFHVSARTLLRRTKAETGHTPLALLQTARVEKAKQLLTGTTWSVARITEKIGYTDVATFSRLFAGRVGETPARYRRR